MRYSIDFRKNGGKMLRRTVAAIATPRRPETPRDDPRRPQHDRVERQHRRAHVEEDVVALAEGLQDRGGEDVEERRVVVEEVAVLHQPRGPTPGHVQVLRLVGVEAEAEVADRPQRERGGRDDGERPALGRGKAIVFVQEGRWCALRDSNPQPADPKSAALSS